MKVYMSIDIEGVAGVCLQRFVGCTGRGRRLYARTPSLMMQRAALVFTLLVRMDHYDITLTAWSYGLVGVVHSAFALNLIRQGQLGAHRSPAGLALLGAVIGSAGWGWLNMAGALTNQPESAVLATFSDLLRYGFWFAFLLLLIQPQQ